MRRRGSILVGLLWTVALLSLLVVSVLHTARIDLMIGKNQADRIQAHYLALAGVEKARALLWRDARERSRGKINHGGDLYNMAREFKDIAFGRGHFSVFRRGRTDEGGGVLYGVSDEESRLNVNRAGTNQLLKLANMNSNIAAAIIDWRDADNQVSPGGAEADYYLSLKPPCRPRNAPFQSVRELLMVRDVSSDLLLGGDRHQNGFFDPGESVAENPPRNDAAVNTDSGWAGLLTADSIDTDVDAAGQDRVNIQSASEGELTRVSGITQPIARAIVAARGQNNFQSIADLLDVTAANQNNASGLNSPGRAGSGNSANGRGGSGGPPVVSQELLMDIADGLTVQSGQDAQGLVNVNTAGREVLACIPGIDAQLADAIISYRQSSGFLPNIALLLQVPGMTPQIFKQAAPYVTARSETYRILCEGRVDSSGVRERIQTIVHVTLSGLSTLAYREDDL